MVGLMGKKIGMTRVFLDDGNVVPVTLIKIDKNVVVRKKTIEKDGYNAIVLGYEELKRHKVKKPYAGIFTENIAPKRYLKEVKVDNPENYKIGDELGVNLFADIKFVDVIGKSKGKGFQGVIKRHGFAGGPASHGSKFHRQNGSTGQNTFPARSFKGLKRAGRMGFERVTVQNLKVINVDVENNILVVKGAIPGSNKSLVFVRKAIKK